MPLLNPAHSPRLAFIPPPDVREYPGGDSAGGARGTRPAGRAAPPEGRRRMRRRMISRTAFTAAAALWLAGGAAAQTVTPGTMVPGATTGPGPITGPNPGASQG